MNQFTVDRPCALTVGKNTSKPQWMTHPVWETSPEGETILQEQHSFNVHTTFYTSHYLKVKKGKNRGKMGSLNMDQWKDEFI